MDHNLVSHCDGVLLCLVDMCLVGFHFNGEETVIPLDEMTADPERFANSGYTAAVTGLLGLLMALV